MHAACRHVARNALVIIVALASLTLAEPGAAADSIPQGPIYTVAGTTFPRGPVRTGRLATDVPLDSPGPMLALPDESLLIAMSGGSIVRVTTAGRITPFAGGGNGLGPEGVRATRAGFDSISALARLPDGSVLVADEDANTVRRITANGRVRTVAGRRGDEFDGGFGGDGGPATRAHLDLPAGLAVTPDGGFVIAEANNRRIRRVAPDGIITTVAGTGRNVHSGDGGPASQASLIEPVAVATEPDGSLLIAEGGGEDEPRQFRAASVRRVAPDGTISTIARLPALSVIPTADGGFLAPELINSFNCCAERVVAVTPDGHVNAIAGGAAESTAAITDGISAQAATLWLDRIAPGPDGGLFLADNGTRIRYWAPSRPRRLAIGIPARTLRTPLRLRVRFILTRRARVVGEARAGGHVVRRAAMRAGAGTDTLTFPHRLSPGSYDITLTASSRHAAPRKTSDTLRVYPGGVLTAGAARQAIVAQAKRDEALGGGHSSVRCVHLARRRADCGVRAFGLCQRIVAVMLRPNGTLVGRDYSSGTKHCRVRARPPRHSRPYALLP
jgi:hypothetical protein